MGEFRNIFLGYNVPTGHDFDARTFPVGSRGVHYQLADIPGNPRVVQVPAGRQFAGLNQIQYRYTVTSAAEGVTGDMEATLGSEFDVGYIPLFQFLAFYSGDLEILPGPAMTMHGPVHTNGTLYLNAENSLTIADLPPTIPSVNVSAVGDLFRGRKDAVACNGTVRIAKLTDSNQDGALDLKTVPCSGVLSDAQVATWLGAMRVHQSFVGVPTPDEIARGTGSFWQAADLRIVLDVDVLDGGYSSRSSCRAPAARSTSRRPRAAAVHGRQARAALLHRPSQKRGKTSPAPAATRTRTATRPATTPDFPTAASVYPCGGSDLTSTGRCATVQNTPLPSGAGARRGAAASTTTASTPGSAC